MVRFQVQYWGEAEPRIVDVAVQNGRLMLLTLLEATELAFAVEKQTGKIISTDTEGYVTMSDLTADPVGIEGRRRLRSMTIRQILERPSGCGYASPEGAYTSIGTTEVSRFPPRVVLSPLNDIMVNLGLTHRWHQEPNQQRTSEVGVVGMGRPDFILHENHQNRRKGSTEGKMPCILHQGRSTVTEQDREVVNLERSQRAYRFDPNEPPADLPKLYNGTQRKTSVRSALGQEAGYMEADNHIIGFLTANSVLYALVLHPAYQGTLFIFEPFLWMSTEVTHRMVMMFGTLVLLGQVSTDGLLAAAGAALATETAARQAPIPEGSTSAGPSSAPSNSRGPAFGTRSQAAGKGTVSHHSKGADLSNADLGPVERNTLLYQSFLAEVQLTRLICDGHAGRVYEGTLLERPVVVKSTDTAHSALGKRLLLNEAAVVTSLAPLWEKVVPALVASGFLGSSFFVNIFQKIDGRKLRKKDTPKALDALRKVHEHGILHGDVKPENFLITKQGADFVIDFGLSRPCTESVELLREEAELQDFW